MTSSTPSFQPPAFMLMKLPDSSYLVCQSIVLINEDLDPAVRTAVEGLFRTHGVQADVCEIPPPTDDDRGVAYLQAKIQAVPGPGPVPGGG